MFGDNQAGQPGRGHRRSQRAPVKLPVVVSGERMSGARNDNTRFYQETRTVVVSAHGALLRLRSKVAVGQLLSVQNSRTREQRACRVVNVAASGAGQLDVGVEFVDPAPDFWRLESPPADWSRQGDTALRQVSEPTPIHAAKQHEGPLNRNTKMVSPRRS